MIRNGSVTNFGVGIEFFVSDGVTVENVNASANMNNGLILLNRAVVRSSRFDDNGNNGLTVGDGAMITSNTATRNGNVGLATATGALIVNNVAINNKLIRHLAGLPGRRDREHGQQQRPHLHRAQPRADQRVLHLGPQLDVVIELLSDRGSRGRASRR